MKFIESRAPWLLATIIFLTTSIIESNLEGTSDIHDAIFAKFAVLIWLTFSLLWVYGLNTDRRVDEFEDFDHPLVGKPVALMLMALCSFIIMMNFMLID